MLVKAEGQIDRSVRYGVMGRSSSSIFFFLILGERNDSSKSFGIRRKNYRYVNIISCTDALEYGNRASFNGSWIVSVQRDGRTKWAISMCSNYLGIITFLSFFPQHVFLTGPYVSLLTRLYGTSSTR